MTSVTDPRKGKTIYSLSELLKVALATVLFRTESKHAFHQESRSSETTEAGIAKFVGIDNCKLPNTKTVDDVLCRLDYQEMNRVLMDLFDNLRKSKLFISHPKLLPRGMYHLAIDAETVHKYTNDSDHNCTQCPHCLKRQRGDDIWYVHMHVTASIVCPGGIRIPLYVYPVHATSLSIKENDSQEAFKQECELSSLPILLKIIRNRFPKLYFCVLLDSLYANGPSIKVLEINNMEWAIVRKNGSMKTVGQDCDGLAKLEGHRKANYLEENMMIDGKKTKRVYEFFNEVSYQDQKLNILRFNEWTFDQYGQEKFHVYWEWIVSWKLTKKNVAQTAAQGRLRWLEEDLFNTLKNRGFKIKHDYSRNPSAQLIWFILINIAFLISELFSRLKQIVSIKKTRSLKDFMKSLFHELRCVGHKVLEIARSLNRGQFRYIFGKGNPGKS